MTGVALWKWENGLAYITCLAADWIAYGEQILARHLVRRVRIADCDRLNCPRIAYIHTNDHQYRFKGVVLEMPAWDRQILAWETERFRQDIIDAAARAWLGIPRHVTAEGSAPYTYSSARQEIQQFLNTPEPPA